MISTSPSNMTTSSTNHNFGFNVADIVWQWLQMADVLWGCLMIVETSTMGVILVAAACFAHVLLTNLCPRTYVPRILSKPSTLSQHLLDSVPRLSCASYRPSGWSDGPHVQTFLALFLPRADQHTIRFDREYLQLTDDGLIGLDWAARPPAAVVGDPSSPIVIIIPPLCGFQSVIRATCIGALDLGFRPVVFHGRGTAGTPLTTARVQSFGDATDFRQVVSYVLSKFPEATLTVIAYGMGNILLISYLGEYGSSAHVSAAVAISPIWDAPMLVQEFPQPYGWIFLALTKRELLRLAEPLSATLDVDSILRSRSFTELCKRLYLPLYGYTDMDEFWDKNNPMMNVDDIAVPLMIIQSSDDPIVIQDSTPFELFNVYPNFFLVLLDAGGHCAFLEGDRLESWAVRTCFEYLIAVMQFVETDARLSNGK